MLIVENVSKSIHDTLILDQLNFTIKPGEIFGFLGPNGAGKSTTVKILVGLNKPTTGRVSFENLDFEKDGDAVRQLTGYVPEKPILYESLTGREFLEFIAGIYQIDSEKIPERIQRVSQLFELDSYLDSLIRTFPKGIGQKLSLAAAWLIEPRLLLLDEPSANLDPKGTRRLKEALVITKNQGVSIFLTTHILEIAEALCDRIAILNRGKIIAAGSMPELRELARGGTSSLEDIFLDLTGGNEYQDLLHFLERK